jgi:hypothetical protein
VKLSIPELSFLVLIGMSGAGIRQQAQQLHRSLRGLEREGFRHVYPAQRPPP